MSTNLKRNHALVLILIPVAALGQLSMDMYLPALKSLQAGMRATASEIQLTLSAFVVCLGVSQFAVGELARRIGRGRAILIALIAFVAAPTPFSCISAIGLLSAGAFFGVGMRSFD